MAVAMINKNAMRCFFPLVRFPHVRDVLAEALRLLPALGAASRYPLDSVIPDKRHEHCNPSGSHHTRYILFRYGCWIRVSAALPVSMPMKWNQAQVS